MIKFDYDFELCSIFCKEQKMLNVHFCFVLGEKQILYPAKLPKNNLVDVTYNADDVTTVT